MENETPKVRINLPPELIHAVDRFWHEKGFMNRTEAVIFLIRYALESKP